MAEEAFQDHLEKTEEPTAKRREEARGKGQFARSKYLIPAATLAVVYLGLRFGGEFLMAQLERCLVGFFTAAAHRRALAAEDLFGLAVEAGLLLAPVVLPLFGAVVLSALGAGVLQSGFALATEPFHVDLSRVNPFAGFRRLVSLDAAMESVKSMIIICGLGAVGASFVYGELAAFTALGDMAAGDLFAYASHEGARLTAWIVLAIGTFAALDYFYQRWRTEAQLRMTRQELKEEMREQEGDPQIKSRLRALRQKMSRRLIGAEVAKADVVITNPTHLAVALRYRAGEMAAPKVLGKGAGFIAEKIREIARQKGIPIVENKPLAQLLYRQVEVGREIPEALYRAVAEVLAYVYRLRRGERGARPQWSPL